MYAYLHAINDCVRVSAQTHEGIKRLAAELDLSVGETVRVAIRRLAQERIGANLAEHALSKDDSGWLDAELG